MKFSVGSDPELLLIDKQGKLISSIGLIGGSKEEPKKTPHGFVQEDNVLVEFNSNPATSEDEFAANILSVMGDIEDIIKPLDLSVKIESSGVFDDDQLNHFLAKLAGCEPDYDAWTVDMNNPPDLGSTNLRSCGGHLHIAFDKAKEDVMSRFDLVKIMDLVAGAPSVLMDTDSKRRSLYGKAGACRPKDVQNNDAYDGVEYRVLSNFWLKSEKHIRWAFNAVKRSIEDFDNLLGIAVAEEQTIKSALNEGNKDAAQHLVKQYNLEVVYG